MQTTLPACFSEEACEATVAIVLLRPNMVTDNEPIAL
jgi:hypothetical protein